jgi:hypothetical protein
MRWDMEEAEFISDPHVLHHGSTDEYDLPSMGGSDIDHLLNAMNM